MGPIYNRIHLGNRNSPELPPRNHFIIKVCVRDPKIDQQRSPCPTVDLGIQNLILGSRVHPQAWTTKDAHWKTMQNPGLGIPNGAIECKLWMSKKHFGGYHRNLSICFRKENLILNRESCFQEGKSCFQEGTSCFQEGNSCFQAGKSCFQHGQSCFQEWDIPF